MAATLLEDAWIALGVAAIAILCGAVLLPWNWFQRRKAIAAAGALRLRLVRPRVRRWRRVEVSLWILITTAFLAHAFLGKNAKDLLMPGSLLLLIAVNEVYRLIGLDLWAVEIRENGLVAMEGFIPWDRLQTYRWEDGKIPTLVLQLGKYAFKRYGVAPEQKSTIDELFREHIQSAPKSASPEGTTSHDSPSG